MLVTKSVIKKGFVTMIILLKVEYGSHKEANLNMSIKCLKAKSINVRLQFLRVSCSMSKTTIAEKIRIHAINNAWNV